jgi:hypothetical protein
MKRQDYQYTLMLNQSFGRILPYSKLFGIKASHLFVKEKSNRAVVDDAIRFVPSQKSKEKPLDNSNEGDKEE